MTPPAYVDWANGDSGKIIMGPTQFGSVSIRLDRHNNNEFVIFSSNELILITSGSQQLVVSKETGCLCGAFATYGAKQGSPLHTMPGRGLLGCPWAPKDNLKGA
jgi:hypothetical protein